MINIEKSLTLPIINFTMKRHKLTLVIFSLILLVLFFQCKQKLQIEQPCNLRENLNATLWMQTSVEYEMVCKQTYALALQHLNAALKDKSWTASLEQAELSGYGELPPAVIVDVDETILDNSPIQARMIEYNQSYSDTLWEKWVREVKSQPIPGAKDFIDSAHALGVKIFYVTNRKLQGPAVENLQNEIDPQITADDVLLQKEQPDWGSDKTSRRLEIAKAYRILLLIGDDYNDFTYLGNLTPNERKEKALGQQKYWGSRWIILPNPTYGSFDKALWRYDYDASDKEKVSSMESYLYTAD